MILDTQFLGALAGQDPSARELAISIEANHESRQIPAAVVYELFYGLGKIADQKPTGVRQRYERLFRAGTVLATTEDIARRAGTIRGKHEVSDELSELDGADAIVAAHGLRLDEPVVSNDNDFCDVVGLSVVSY